MAVLVLCGRAERAHAAECDDCVPADQFQDSDWKGKKDDPKKPPHRLKTPACEGCKDAVKALQDALDDCKAKTIEDIGTIDFGAENAGEQQRKKNAAKDALRGNKGHKPPKGKSLKQLEQAVRDKCEKVQWSCPNNQPGGNTVNETGSVPGNQPANASGGSSGQGQTGGGAEKPPSGNGQDQLPSPNGPQPAAPTAPQATHVLKIDFVINRGVSLEQSHGDQTHAEDDKVIDEYLDKVNKAFAGADIGFKRNSTTYVNDPNLPEYPEAPAQDNTASKEQNDVAKEAEAKARQLANKGDITVKIVRNFYTPETPAPGETPTPTPKDFWPTSKNGGITIGPTIIVVDRFDVDRNNMGHQDWDRTLTHELGHRLGLGHKVLPSDKDYPNQAHGQYTAPNAMAPEGSMEYEFTEDQIAEIKSRYAKEFGNKPGQTIKNVTPGLGGTGAQRQPPKKKSTLTRNGRSTSIRTSSRGHAGKSGNNSSSWATPAPSTTEKVTDTVGSLINLGLGVAGDQGRHVSRHDDRGHTLTKGNTHAPTPTTRKTSKTMTKPKTVTSACKCHPCTCSPCTCH